MLEYVPSVHLSRRALRIVRVRFFVVLGASSLSALAASTRRTVVFDRGGFGWVVTVAAAYGGGTGILGEEYPQDSC